MRVVAAHHVADDRRALAVLGVGEEPLLPHRVEDAALHRLQAVAHVGQRAARDDGERVVQVPRLRDLVERRRSPRGSARRGRPVASPSPRFLRVAAGRARRPSPRSSSRLISSLPRGPRGRSGLPASGEQVSSLGNSSAVSRVTCSAQGLRVPTANIAANPRQHRVSTGFSRGLRCWRTAPIRVASDLAPMPTADATLLPPPYVLFHRSTTSAVRTQPRRRRRRDGARSDDRAARRASQPSLPSAIVTVATHRRARLELSTTSRRSTLTACRARRRLPEGALTSRRF